MTARITLGLLRAARAEFAERILPALPPEDRYTGAMLARALDVLLAEATAADPPDGALRQAGLGDAARLAADLRAGAQPDSAALRAALRAYVEARLAITNPRFLARTGALPEEDLR